LNKNKIDVSSKSSNDTDEPKIKCTVKHKQKSNKKIDVSTESCSDNKVLDLSAGSTEISESNEHIKKVRKRKTVKYLGKNMNAKNSKIKKCSKKHIQQI